MSKLFKVTVSVHVFASCQRDAADAVREAMIDGVLMDKQIYGESVEEVTKPTRLNAAPLGHDEAEHGFHFIPEAPLDSATASLEGGPLVILEGTHPPEQTSADLAVEGFGPPSDDNNIPF